VTNLNDAGSGSLRQAILDTPAGGTVDFQPGLNGTITLMTDELLINKDVTIAGPGADVITINGNDDFRVFEIRAPFTVAITGLTIVNGNSSNGGGIFNSGTLTVTSSTLARNFALAGDGGSGAGISNGGTLFVTNSSLDGNYADFGGGISNSFGTVTINNSTLSGNTTTLGGSGGGIFNSFGTVTINNSTLSGNSAYEGGGILNAGTLTVTSSTLSGNIANSGGGSSGSGGGIDNTFGGTLTITGSTFSRNSARTGGGAISTSDGFTHSRNTIIAGNGPGPDLAGNLGSQGHNLIGNTQGGSGFDPTDLLNVDPLLGPLQDNGGPTLTMALLPSSPAIDAGDNTDAPMWDQRGPGFRRVVNGTIDIGAFEVQAPAASYPTRLPLPDPVPVQALGIPGGPLLGQPPDLLTPLPEPSNPDAQAGPSEPVPVPTATGQQAPATLLDTYPGSEQPVASLGSLSTSDLDVLALNLLGGP
jgi:predicted outer membrane repeat protein